MRFLNLAIEILKLLLPTRLGKWVSKNMKYELWTLFWLNQWMRIFSPIVFLYPLFINIHLISCSVWQGWQSKRFAVCCAESFLSAWWFCHLQYQLHKRNKIPIKQHKTRRCLFLPIQYSQTLPHFFSSSSPFWWRN